MFFSMQIQPIVNNPGIYFNNIGNVHIYQATWTLIINYNLTSYLKEFDQLDKCVFSIAQLCAKLNEIHINNTECIIITKQLNNQLHEIQTSQQFLFPSHRITKRSLVDVGGYALNYVFGTLDDRYAKSNNENLLNLKNRQDFLSSIMHKHTSILDNTLSLIKKTDSEIHSQFELFNQHLKKIDFNRNHDKLAWDLYQHLNFLSTYTTLIFTKFRTTQLHILDTLTSAHSSGLQLLSPALLLNELKNIETQLPSDLHLPKTNNRLNPEIILKISKMECEVFQPNLLCVIHIPMLINTNYQIFRTFAVPTKGPHGYSYIEPQTDILLVSFNRDQSTYLSKADFHTCFQNIDSTHICESHNPIFISSTKNFDCELQLLNHARSVPKSCTIKQAIAGDYWIQIDSNHYIFVLDEPLTVDLICNNNITHYPLAETGTILIPPKCQIRSKDLILYAGNSNPRAVHTAYVPSLNISDLIPHRILNSWLTSQTPFLIQLNDSKRISDLTTQMQNLKENLILEPKLNLHFQSNSHIYLIIILIILTLILIIYVVNKLSLIHRCRQTYNLRTNRNLNPPVMDPHPLPFPENIQLEPNALLPPKPVARNPNPEYAEIKN